MFLNLMEISTFFMVISIDCSSQEFSQNILIHLHLRFLLSQFLIFMEESRYLHIEVPTNVSDSDFTHFAYIAEIDPLPPLQHRFECTSSIFPVL